MPPEDILDRIGMARLEPSSEFVLTMSSDEKPQAPSEFTMQPFRLPRASARCPETRSSFIYFRHSKVLSDIDSETHFVIEFETIDGDPVTLWETQAFSGHIHYRLKWSDSTNSNGIPQASKPTYCRKRSSR